MRGWLVLGALAAPVTAIGDVAFIIAPQGYAEYFCPWYVEGRHVDVVCDSTSQFDYQIDRGFVYGGDFELTPGNYSVTVPPIGFVPGLERSGCDFFHTTVDDDPNGAVLHCP